MECVYILESVNVMKAGLMKIVHEVRKNAGIHSKAPVKTAPAVCVDAFVHVYIRVCVMKLM